MINIAIFGTTNLAKLAYYYATKELNYNVQAFIVDDSYYTLSVFEGLPVYTWSAFKERFGIGGTYVFVAVGYKNMRARMELYEKIRSYGYQSINVISKYSYVSDKAIIGNNNIVMPGTVIETFTEIGSNNVFWSNTTICHDTKIGSHNFFASNVTIGGEVTIGDANFFGFSSTLIQGVNVEDDVLVGASSLVLTDLKKNCQYQGMPARYVKAIDSGLGVRVN